MDDIEKRQLQNWNSFTSWISNHGKSLVPIPDVAVLYSGYSKPDLAKLKKGLIDESEVRGMWKIIQIVEKNARDYSGRVTIEIIDDVLKRHKSPLPKLVEATGSNAGQKVKGANKPVFKKYSDMLSCANALASDNWQLLKKPHRKIVWDLLSKQYAANLSGDVQVWEGVSKEMKNLERYKVMVRTELAVARKNKKIDPKSMKNIESLLKKYEAHYGKIESVISRNDKALKASFKKSV